MADDIILKKGIKIDPASEAEETTEFKIGRKSKKELAFFLYIKTDLTQAQIADKVSVHPNTVQGWAAREDWDLIRSAGSITRKKQVRNYLMQLAELNQSIQDREEGARYATMKEADIIAKISTTIEKIDKDIRLDDYITVFESFLIFLRAVGVSDVCKEIEPYMNEFMLLKAAELR